LTTLKIDTNLNVPLTFRSKFKLVWICSG